MTIKRVGAVAGVLVLAACGPVPAGGPANPLSTAQSTSSGQSGSGQPGGGEPAGSSDAAPTGEVAEPASYVARTWQFKPDPNNGGSSATVQVPKGWAETVRDKYWSDFLDPTGQVRLRVNVTTAFLGEPGDPTGRAAADAEVARLHPAAGFKLLSERDLPAGATDDGATEIVYQFSRDGRTVLATARFVGAGLHLATLTVYYPPGQDQVADDVLTKARDTLQFAG